jgi:hypothetical protein
MSAGRFLIYANGDVGPIPDDLEGPFDSGRYSFGDPFVQVSLIQAGRTGGHLYYHPARGLFNTATGQTHRFTWYDGPGFNRRNWLQGTWQQVAAVNSRSRVRWKFVFVEPECWGYHTQDGPLVNERHVDPLADKLWPEWPPRFRSDPA